MTLSNQTIEILEDIERRLDPEAEDDYMKQWEDFLYDRFDGGVFTPRRKTVSELNFKHPKDIVALIGHTRHSTQGSEKKNYNNHPFFGRMQGCNFALAHYGVLWNDDDLKQELLLPQTKIETDSFVAVQLLELLRLLL